MQQDSKQIIKGLPRRIALMLLDCGLIVVCYWLAVMLRFDSGDAYRRVEIVRAMAPMLPEVTRMSSTTRCTSETKCSSRALA